jgi:hypothetical protein
MSTTHMNKLIPWLISALVIGPTLLAAEYDAGSTIPTSKESVDAATKESAKRTGLQKVFIAYKTHFDIGYTSTAHDVVHEYRTEMADRLLHAIEVNQSQPKEKQFVWTLSGYPMQQILWEGQSPERRAKIEEGIRDGNVAIHALPYTIHTETAEAEDLVRGLGISSALARKYGQPLSISGKSTDAPGQSWILPTLMAHAGIKFFHMGGPVVNFPFNLPPVFWWEGPDGSRVLTFYNNDYGIPAMPPANWPYKTWLHLSMTGDNQGPPSPGAVQSSLDFYKARGIDAMVGTMDDFYREFSQEDLSQLPVIRADLPCPWIHGVASQPVATKVARNSRPLIGALDQLNTLEQCWGVFRPEMSQTIRTAYERTLRFAEHTFGMANQHYVKQPFGKGWEDLWAQGLPLQYQLMEESWREKADCALDAARLIEEPYKDAISTLADNVNVTGGRIVVYNPLPWKRDAKVPINCFHLPGGTSAKPVDGGPAVPFAYEPAPIEDKTRVRSFIAKDLPPMGYRTYVVSNDKTEPDQLAMDEKTGVIESAYFKATFDAKRGRIASLIDKRSGRELVDASAPHGFGQYLYERFSYQDLTDWLAKSLYGQYQAHKFAFVAFDMPEDSKYESALPSDMTLSMKKSPIEVTAVMTGTIPGPGMPQQVYIRLTLPATMPVADLEVGWDKKPDGWPEAGWICLPFKVDNFKFRVGKLGGDLDPVEDYTLDNLNTHNLWVNTGVAVYDDKTGAGVGICPKDSPMVSLGSPGEYKFAKRYVPSRPYIYVHLYNNHWRTNFRSWIGDGARMTSTIRLWAFDQFNAESCLYTPAMENRVPVAAARSVAHPGKLPPAQAGITLSRKGVAVSAFGPNPDGKGIILRVWEQTGTTGELTVTLPTVAKFVTATPVTLRGQNTGEPLKVADDKLTFNLKAYAPVSFILE